jgi:hypothetical protein
MPQVVLRVVHRLEIAAVAEIESSSKSRAALPYGSIAVTAGLCCATPPLDR